MQALAFWKAVAMDESNFIEGLIGLLAEHKIRYCVIGGQGVNAWLATESPDSDGPSLFRFSIAIK
jgi:hypothetical protein